jgi:hypothetical protein
MKTSAWKDRTGGNGRGLKRAPGIRRAAPAAALLVAALLSGCAALGYRVGNTLPPDIQAVFVPTFENKTREPQLETATTRAMVQEIQKDGNLRVATREQADAILDVTLMKLDQEALRYDDRNTLKGKEFRLKLTAHILFKRKGGAKLVERDVIGEATFSASGDVSTPRREALPKAAEDLAYHIRENIMEYW